MSNAEITDRAEAVSIPGSERRQFDSAVLGDVLELQIVRIGIPGDDDATVPAVYLMDGNLHTGIVAGAALMMEIAQEVPEHLLVGVGYPQASDLLSRLQRRSFDLSPTTDTNWEAEAAAQGMDWKTGGGPRFLEALTNELFPFIEAEYSTDPAQRVLAGHSAGATFALDAMFASPARFSAYVAASPSLWWDDRYMFRREEQYARDHEDLATTLFLSVGGLESTPRPELPEGEQAGVIADAMVGNVHRLSDALEARRYASLNLETQVFEGETHTSGVAAALVRGLRVALGPAELTVSTQLEAIERHLETQ